MAHILRFSCRTTVRARSLLDHGDKPRWREAGGRGWPAAWLWGSAQGLRCPSKREVARMRRDRMTGTRRTALAFLIGLLTCSWAFALAPASVAQRSGIAAPMGIARAAHTATLLPTGQVVVVGGHDGSRRGANALGSAERYDPAADRWTAVRPMVAPRAYHTATLLPDGRILVVGGRGGNAQGGAALNTVELYNPATDTWTGAAPLATPRSNHTATLLPDGRVLVVGGAETRSGLLTPVPSAEIYDPAANSWTAVGPLGTARSGHTATLLSDGRVIVAGGGSSPPAGAGAPPGNP